MTESTEIIWKNRYRELEKTIEQLIIAFGSKLGNAEQLAWDEQGQSWCSIRKVVRNELVGSPLLTCVADGSNLEFQFNIQGAGGAEIIATPFQRSNSLPLTTEVLSQAQKCIVAVRANTPVGSKIVTKEISL